MNYTITNLAAYEMPQAVEDKFKEYVAYGEDNDYFSFLIQQYLQSATNNAAIKSISDLIYGQGICIDGLEKDSKEVKELKKLINHRDLKKSILERKMCGMAAMQGIYTKAGNDRKVVGIKDFHIPTIRTESVNADGERGNT